MSFYNFLRSFIIFFSNFIIFSHLFLPSFFLYIPLYIFMKDIRVKNFIDFKILNNCDKSSNTTYFEKDKILFR